MLPLWAKNVEKYIFRHNVLGFECREKKKRYASQAPIHTHYTKKAKKWRKRINLHIYDTVHLPIVTRMWRKWVVLCRHK